MTGGVEGAEPENTRMGGALLISKNILTQPFAARLTTQHESHIRVTKETIQFVATLTKEIPHGYCVTKEKNTKVIPTRISPADREIKLIKHKPLITSAAMITAFGDWQQGR